MNINEAAELPQFITSCKFFVVLLHEYGCMYGSKVLVPITSCNACPLNCRRKRKREDEITFERIGEV
jgi:aldehyde:ferredoxin oxidoreductase